MHTDQGFEIVSYMIDGRMNHEDSLDVSHTAYENEGMSITAGSGIEHSEFPADGTACSGLQLWMNLSSADKEVEPNYSDATASELPTEQHAGAAVTTVVGDGSPLSLHTPIEYLDVRVDDRWEWSIPDTWTGFLYGAEGEGTVDSGSFADGDLIASTGTRDIAIRSDEMLRLVAISGRPHNEPIRQQGPVVL